MTPISAPKSRLDSETYKLRHEFDSLQQLLEEYRMVLRNRDKWRLCYPNKGFLIGFPEFTSVHIMATDGCEAYFDVGNPDVLFHGHVANFIGPVSNQEIEEVDWDYVTNRRRVRILGRREDGTWIVVPKDTWMEEYWALHSREGMPEVKLSKPKQTQEQKVGKLLDGLLI